MVENKAVDGMIASDGRGDDNGVITSGGIASIPADKPVTVIGMAYGDEGKGMTVGFLSRLRYGQTGRQPIVARWNGGPQAAHNVRIGGKHHTFSQYGSGSLTGAWTLLTDKMLVSPFALMEETVDLMEHCGVSDPLSRMIIDRSAPILLPLHAEVNRELERKRGSGRHGSTGIGVGVAREYEDIMSTAGERDSIPMVGDMSDPFVMADKIATAKDWLEDRWGVSILLPPSEVRRLAVTLHTVWDDWMAHGVRVTGTGTALWDHRDHPEDVIFEGAQGVMLDAQYGWFPHVTYGDMLPGAASVMAVDAGLHLPFMLGVTRTYSTRHGAGPFPVEGTADITEVDNGTGLWQGAFRTGVLDLGILDYTAGLVRPDAMAVSCLDLYPGRVVTHYRDDHDGGMGTPVLEDMSLGAALDGIIESTSAHIAVLGSGAGLGEWRLASDAISDAGNNADSEPISVDSEPILDPISVDKNASNSVDSDAGKNASIEPIPEPISVDKNASIDAVYVS